MNNSIQHAHDTSTRTAPSGGVVSGVPIVIGSEFLIPIASADEGDLFAASRTGTFELTKNTDGGSAWAEGDQLYWDDGNSRVTKTSASGLFPIGTAGAVNLDADTEGHVRLDGVAVTAVP